LKEDRSSFNDDDDDNDDNSNNGDDKNNGFLRHRRSKNDASVFGDEDTHLIFEQLGAHARERRGQQLTAEYSSSLISKIPYGNGSFGGGPSGHRHPIHETKLTYPKDILFPSPELEASGLTPYANNANTMNASYNKNASSNHKLAFGSRSSKGEYGSSHQNNSNSNKNTRKMTTKELPPLSVPTQFMIQVVLNHQLKRHQAYLSPFLSAFTEFDTDKDNMVTQEQFLHIYRRLSVDHYPKVTTPLHTTNKFKKDGNSGVAVLVATKGTVDRSAERRILLKLLNNIDPYNQNAITASMAALEIYRLSYEPE